MTGKIPVFVAERIAINHYLRQVILVAWDGEQTHVVTYGVTTEESGQAAEGGNRVKAALGWPEDLCKEQSPRVKALVDEITNLNGRLANSEAARISAEGSLAMLRLGIDEAMRMKREREIAESPGSDPGDDPDNVGY